MKIYHAKTWNKAEIVPRKKEGIDLSAYISREER